MSDTFMTAREAAAFLKSSPSTLAKLRLAGGGPAFCRIGRAIRYRRADLESWMGQSVRKSTSS
jgi:excisionase family DNA binding protein